MDELIQAKENSILTLTLSRPDKRNALNDKLIKALKKELRNADKDEELNAIVIKGAGKDFCSGADLSTLQETTNSDILENLKDAESLMQLFLSIRKVKIPVVAAVHGNALAGGCGLATACDIVLASKSARFGYPEVKIGFVPAMVMAFLRRNLSEKKSFELVTQGFAISSQKAEEIGLINRVFDDTKFENGVKKYVSTYQKVSRTAVILSKKLLYQMDNIDIETALSIGTEINVITRFTEDCRKGINKFLSRP